MQNQNAFGGQAGSCTLTTLTACPPRVFCFPMIASSAQSACGISRSSNSGILVPFPDKKEKGVFPPLPLSTKEKELPYPSLFSFDTEQSSVPTEKRGMGKGDRNAKIHNRNNSYWLSHVFVPKSLQTEEFLKAWADWIEYRMELARKMRWPVTQAMFEKQIRFLFSIGPDRAVYTIDTAINCGWRGLFLPREQKPKQSWVQKEKDRIANSKWGAL